MNRSELARAIGMDLSQLGRIERGDVQVPEIETMEKIARQGLGVPVAVIAPPDYYTEAQLKAARAEVLALHLSETEEREALASLDAALRAIRSKGRTG